MFPQQNTKPNENSTSELSLTLDDFSCRITLVLSRSSFHAWHSRRRIFHEKRRTQLRMFFSPPSITRERTFQSHFTHTHLGESLKFVLPVSSYNSNQMVESRGCVTCVVPFEKLKFCNFLCLSFILLVEKAWCHALKINLSLLSFLVSRWSPFPLLW